MCGFCLPFFTEKSHYKGKLASADKVQSFWAGKFNPPIFPQEVSLFLYSFVYSTFIVCLLCDRAESRTMNQA